MDLHYMKQSTGRYSVGVIDPSTDDLIVVDEFDQNEFDHFTDTVSHFLSDYINFNPYV